MQRSGTENRSNQNPNPALKTITENNNYSNYKDNMWLTEWAAFSQKVAIQQPKPN